MAFDDPSPKRRGDRFYCPYCDSLYPDNKFTPDCGSSLTTTGNHRSRACRVIEGLRGPRIEYRPGEGPPSYDELADAVIEQHNRYPDCDIVKTLGPRMKEAKANV